MAGLLLGSLALLSVAVLFAAIWMTRMPGRSQGPVLPPLTEEETALRDRIAGHVAVLGGDIGERNPRRPEALHRALGYVRQELASMGYEVREQPFVVGGIEVGNLEVILPGVGSLKSGCVVVGAHVDTAPGSPGANDNGSGVAVVLELARRLRDRAQLQEIPRAEIRFVVFTNEEPPFFGTADMGSLRYARELRAAKTQVIAMISVETVGYYTDLAHTQTYPSLLAPLYPDTGNFIAFVGNLKSRSLLRKAIRAFRLEPRLPSEGGALPGDLPGVGWSDHWAFWETGYPAIMVTDTAPFRYPEYHEPGDLPERVDAARMARLTAGLDQVLRELAGGGKPPP